MPEGSRGALEIKVLLLEGLIDLGKNAAVAELDPIAQWLAGTLAQLAIAWVSSRAPAP